MKILEKKTLVDKIASNGKRVRYDEVLIGDETGCMALNVHGGMFKCFRNQIALATTFTYALSC